MNNFRSELEQLTDLERAYVMKRSKVRSDAQGYREANISKASFYSWDAERREMLNKLARRMSVESDLRIYMILQENDEKAAETIANCLNSRKEHIKLAAAQAVLDRLIGKPTQRQEISGPDKGPIVVLDWEENGNGDQD